MKDEGWTMDDLDGELRARGMTLDDTELDPSGYWMGKSSADEAAEYLAKLKDE